MSSFKSLEEVKKIFDRDAEKHEMTIEIDNGVNRSILFMNPKTSIYWFRIVTFNNGLLIDGDCGSYCFKRLPDMFDFFRGGRVNVGYWAEKCVSHSDELKQFNMEKVREIFKDIAQDFDGNEEEKEILDEALDRDFENEYELNNFIDRNDAYFFQDFFEHTLTSYTASFIWNLCAIAYAVTKYEEAKAISQSVEVYNV